MGINSGNNNWQVCAHAHISSGIDVDLTDHEHWNWSDAQLPFDAISWLNAHGHGPDPMILRNDLHYRWVEDFDWVLRKKFRIDADIFPVDDELQLVLNHVDCYCDVYLDGKRIGRAKNQFRAHVFDLDELATDSEHEILLYIRSARNVNNVLEGAYGQLPAGFDTGRVHSRRCQVLTGWDFTPRLSSVSVLSAPEILSVKPVNLSSPHVYTNNISGVVPGQGVADKVLLHLRVDVSSRRRASGNLQWDIIDCETGEIVASITDSISIKPRKQQIEWTLELPSAKLWWSAGLGEQPLYKASVTLNASDRLNNNYADDQICSFGVRSLIIERQKDDVGESFRPVLNGIPVFCRGANWLPISMLPSRVQADDYRKLIAAALGAGINCLRVWGGGIYEHDEFYNLCDRAGILVWQDFMFACAAYPVYREFLDEVEAEAVYQVRRLQNHPSLMLWCGNSENAWLHQLGDLKKGSEHRIIGESIWSHVLREVVEDYDPSRAYHQSSPFGKNRLDHNDMASGDRHSWAVWADWESSNTYLQDTGRFISEFGVQALPSQDTLKAIAPDATDLNDLTVAHHQRMPEGTERLVRYVAAQYSIPQDLRGWVETTQEMQSRMLAQGAEHWRRQRHHTAGCLIWHFNEPYPGITCSLIDHYHRPKTALASAQRFFAPVLLSMDLRINEVAVTAVPPELWKKHRTSIKPPDGLNAEQSIVCDPMQSVVQCKFHIINGTALELSGIMHVDFSAPELEAEPMPGAQVTLEPNGAQVALTHLLDDEILERIDQIKVRAWIELDEESQTKFDALNAAILARQKSLHGAAEPSPDASVCLASDVAAPSELALPADFRSGLVFEGALVDPKYFRS